MRNNEITVEDISDALHKYKQHCKNHKISPDYIILHPGEKVIPRYMFFDLQDKTEIKLSVKEYNLFEKEYGDPSSCIDLKEFKDKLMVIKL